MNPQEPTTPIYAVKWSWFVCRMQKAVSLPKVRFLILRVCCALFRVKSGVVLFCVTSALWKRDQPVARFCTGASGVYIEEHDGRKQVWCYVIKPRDAQSTLLKGEKL